MIDSKCSMDFPRVDFLRVNIDILCMGAASSSIVVGWAKAVEPLKSCQILPFLAFGVMQTSCAIGCIQHFECFVKHYQQWVM